MEIKLITIFFLFLCFFWLIVTDKIKGRHTRELKCYLLTIFIVSLVVPTQHTLFEYNLTKQAAVFGDIISIGSWHVLIILIFICSSNNVNKNMGNSIRWLSLFSLIAVCTYFNPYNSNPTATIVGSYYVLSLLVSSIIIYRKFNFDEMFFSIWIAFKIIVIIELVLAIAYPVLKLDAATAIFFGKNAIENATRGDRPSAIGTFVHPGPLGLIMTFIFTFFAANYIYGNRKRESLIYLILSGIVIILTQSRTCYIVAVLSLLLLYVFHKAVDTTNIFRYSLSGMIMLIAASYVFVFMTSMGADLFLSDNFAEMQIARLDHWYLGWKAFTDNIIMGTGLNAHLSYISSSVSFAGIKGGVGAAEFYEISPVHNTHLIVLSELGLIGGLVWFYGFFSAFGTNIKALIKLNLILPVDSSGIGKYLAISQIFTPAVIIVYSIYAFTGWATTHYYSLSFLLLALILSEKGRHEYVELMEH